MSNVIASANVTRVVSVYATKGGSKMKAIDSSAMTFGELIADMAENEIEFNIKTHKATIATGSMKHVTLDVMTATLPNEAFSLVIVQKEGKGGAMELEWPEDVAPAQQRNTFLRNLREMGDAIKDFFSEGEAYHKKKSAELKELIDKWNESLNSDDTTDTVTEVNDDSIVVENEAGAKKLVSTPPKSEIASTIRLLMNLPDVKVGGENREALEDLES